MQSGGYRDLAGKTPSAAASAITPTAAATPQADPATLERRIRQVCGLSAVSVQVRSESPKRLKVQVKIKKAGEAEPLATKILALPELGPYEVSLSMTADRQ